MKNLLFALLLATAACKAQKSFPVTGTIERYDSAINALLLPDAKAEIIATGFEWSEGPVWIEKSGMLLFSDVPRNTVYQWTEDGGTKVYLTPSGYTGSPGRGGEMGSNGLALDAQGRLVLCQHGDRRVARMDAPVPNPAPKFITLAGSYRQKKFNSPNDAVYNRKGDLYFTDPPYGLEGNMTDPGKEIPFQGVYRLTPSGSVALLTDSVTRPNGIAFSPDEKTLFVANSDSTKPHWYIFDVNENGTLANGRIFYTSGYEKGWKGNNDGLKVDKAGNIFATGPGGVWIFDKSGKLLGKLRLDEAASNCAFADDERTLYITNDSQVLRLKMR
jgi:gluconolactonase